MIFYYSGCGNSRYVAETLAQQTGEAVVFIPDAVRQDCYAYTVGAGESVGFVFPIYAWGPPRLVLDFVKGLQLTAAATYIYMVATCGDNAGMTHRIFRKTLQQRGWSLNATFFLRMPNTYVFMAGMSTDTPNRAKAKLDEAAKRLPVIARAISNREEVQETLKGGLPYLKSYVTLPLFYKIMSDKPMHVTERCTGCGICAKNCPLHNITIEEGHPKWHGHCTHCTACYHHCPQNAIQYGSLTRGKGQYYYGRKQK